MGRDRQMGEGRAPPPGQQEGQQGQARLAVRQVQPGMQAERRPRIARDQQHEPAPACDAAECRQHGRREAARHDPRPARQPLRRRPRIGQALRIGEQPEAGEAIRPLWWLEAAGGGF